MLLSELRFFQDKYDTTFQDALNSFVKEKGLGTGDGSNARVIWIKGKNWVWRGWFSDKGYERFMKFVETNQNNPHLPKILSKVREEPVQFKRMPKGMKIKYVKLEFLEECEPQLAKEITDVFNIIHQHNPKSLQELESIFKKLPKQQWVLEAKITFEQFPKLFETIIDLVENHYANDIQSTNIMMRGNVPVITDPISES